MSAIRVKEKAATIDDLVLELSNGVKERPAVGQCLIEVHGAGVNPSDVKATLGAMPHAVWPRTPGRDYAGVVIDGPNHLMGKEVWGSGGELGIRRDGTHAKYLVVNADSVREKPRGLSMLEASAVGVPFITAYEGFRRAGMPRAGEVVLVCGANGKVGQAAVQLAAVAGARVFAVARSGVFKGHASSRVDVINPATQPDIAAYVREQTNGHGADIVYNTVGSPYFAQANLALAIRGRQIFISTLDRAVPFDIFSFYRGQHSYVGIDTLDMDSRAGAEILDALAPGFESGSLRPFPVHDAYVFSLSDAVQAYREVLSGATERVVLRP